MFSIGPQFYFPIYYSLVALLSFLTFSRYETFSEERLYSEERESNIGIVLFTLFIVLFIGLRPLSGKYFVDMANYNDVYNAIKGRTFILYTGWEGNLLFDNLFSYMATSGVHIKWFFLIVATVYFIGISWACSLLFPRDKFAAILVYLMAFSTYAYATNGVKAGAAAALFLLAMAFYQKRQWVGVVITLLLSFGMHHAMVMPIAAFLICHFVKNPRIFLVFWVVCFFLALFHVTFFQELFASMINEHGAEYLLGKAGYVRTEIFGGFRIDFVLYSVVPIVVGLIAIEKKHIQSEKYEFILNLYTLTNAIWLLCMYSDYTNRIAYLSWFMYPIVLIYPFLNEEWEGPQYKYFQWVAYGHMAFNLFMAFIYW